MCELAAHAVPAEQSHATPSLPPQPDPSCNLTPVCSRRQIEGLERWATKSSFQWACGAASEICLSHVSLYISRTPSHEATAIHWSRSRRPPSVLDELQSRRSRGRDDHWS